MKRWLVPVLLIVPAAAWAHSAGISRGDYRFEDGTLFGTIVFARSEVSDLVPHLDANRDGTVTPEEVQAALPGIDSGIVQGVKVTAGGSVCPGKLDGSRLVEGDGLEITGQWVCAPPAAEATVEILFLGKLTPGHRHLLTLVGASASAASFAYRDAPSFEVPALRATPRGSLAAGLNAAKLGAAGALLPMALLLAILAFGGSSRQLLQAVAAFAVGLGVAGLVAMRLGFLVSLAAPGAALVLLYAGIDGLASGDGQGRWLAALVAGAVDGVWLAQRFGGLALPARQREAAALPFVVGAILLLSVVGGIGAIVLGRLQAAGWFRRLVPSASAFLLLAAGAFWLVRLA